MPPKLILHIDDDEDDCLLLKEVFAQIGNSYQLIQQHNGIDAIRYLQRAKSESELPALIILDLNMPYMDGKEFIINIKKDNVLSKLPLIVFSTSSSALDKEFCAHQGVDLIEKPFNVSELNNAVQTMLQLCKSELTLKGS